MGVAKFSPYRDMGVIPIGAHGGDIGVTWGLLPLGKSKTLAVAILDVVELAIRA